MFSNIFNLESVENILNGAICRYGIKNQFMKLGEELNELAVEIFKVLQYKEAHNKGSYDLEDLIMNNRFIGEYADVIIMMYQINVIMGNDNKFKNAVEKMIQYKINRLEEKLYKE